MSIAKILQECNTIELELKQLKLLLLRVFNQIANTITWSFFEVSQMPHKIMNWIAWRQKLKRKLQTCTEKISISKGVLA